MIRRIEVPQGQVPALGQRALLDIERRNLALFNVEGQFYAIDDSCPHQGSSLCAGKLEGRVIQCRAHGLRFDLASGQLLNSPQVKVARYPVERDGDRLYIVILSEDSAP